MQMMPDISTLRLEPAQAAGGLVDASLRKSLYYYRRTAAAVFAVMLALGLIATLLIPARYRSEAKLLALTSDYYDVRMQSSESKSEQFKPEEVVNLEMQLLSSHDLHREALRRIPGAPTDPAALERARDAFSKALSVTKASDANVIDLAFIDSDPVRARIALDRLIAIYQQSRARLLLSGQASQLTQQRDAARADLATATDRLRRFQAEHGIADIDAQIAGAIAVDTGLRQRLSDAAADLSSARSSLARLRATAGRVPQTVEIFRDDTEAAKGIADMQNQILQLEARRADLAGRYMPGSPLIVQVDKQIAGLRQAVTQQTGQLQAARRTGRNAAYDSAVGQLRDGDATAAGDAAKHTRLTGAMTASAARLETLNGLAATIADLKLARDVAQERFRTLARQVDDARARADDALTSGSNVRVIQAANVPTRRSNPVWLIAAGALFAALLVTAVVLFLRVIGRTVILDRVEAAREAGVPVIADLRLPRLGLRRDGSGGDLSARLAMLPGPADGGGRVIALVATDTQDLHEVAVPLLEELDGGRSGTVALLSFGAAAYDDDPGYAAALHDALHDSLAEDALVEIGGQAWQIDDAGRQAIEALRRQRRWVLILLPPIDVRDEEPGLSARSRAQIAAAADQVLVLAQTEHTRKASLRTITALMGECGREPVGVVLGGRRIRWPRYVASA